VTGTRPAHGGGGGGDRGLCLARWELPGPCWPRCCSGW
jgi:hypothetical protein